ncbi:vesicle transport v-snare protein vti1 [Dendrothele bispora CBS 962.96]|uniref:Vesicle transport v-snare protein vti1 n=1 Tax=Dendrothele bispora (strain CBS 962.96) TaxID=1314807 RepID=A0A4S8LZJ8_DENBC|nr:vesicle transport v-snare protein vti1 [Dendrothele bispora CBS 962.96]
MDSTPVTLFESYHQDYEHIIRGVKQKLEKDAQEQRGEQRKATLRRVEMDLDSADDLISQLEAEVQGIPTSIRPQYASRARQAKMDLQRYKKLARDMHYKASRADWMDGHNPSSDQPYEDGANERTRLLSGHERLNDASQRLQNSTRLALETEDAGADILRALVVQREQIENARGTLNNADTSIDRASGTIKKMIRQMYKQRFIIASLILVLVIVIIVILYFKLIRH